MMFASTNAAGQCVATAPDVCKTPSPGGPVPIPYPNFGMVPQIMKYSTKVKFSMRNAVHIKSEIPTSVGDQPGTLLGVKSNTVMNKVIYKKGTSKVKIEGKKAVYHLTMTGHNGANLNIVGIQAAPSQTNVLVAP